MTNFYSILGVEKTATQDEIKQAYRKLASKHHPDKGGETAKFQELQGAYETLSDPTKRATYDNPQPSMNGFHFNGGNGHGFEDIFRGFGDIFGQQNRAPVNRVITVQATITLEDAFHGKSIVANLTLPSGKNQLIEVNVPPGIHDGTTLRLAELGDDTVANAPRGDIHLTIRVLQHALFHRQDDDLIHLVTVNCIEAMLGKIITVESIDKKILEIKIVAGTQPGQVFALRDSGMPVVHQNGARGRMLLKVNISIPTDISDSQKSLLSQFFN